MASAEAETAQETKMVVDEQPNQEEKKEDEKKVEEQKEEEKKEEEQNESVARRRSTRISTTATAPTNGSAGKGRKPGPKAAKKRSADDLAEADATDAKTKKAKKVTEKEEEGMKLGESLPDLVLKNEQSEEVKVQNLAENKKGVVLFLVPKADTPGCTTQACGFRDQSADFISLDFVVYCLSADAPDKQKKWKDKKSLPFPLLSDPERSLIEKLTGSNKKTARSHFVFAGGKLVDKRIPVKPVDSPRLALEFIRALEVGNTSTTDATKAPDTADVAAASAAATAAVEPAEPITATSVVPEPTAAEIAPVTEAAQSSAPAS